MLLSEETTKNPKPKRGETVEGAGAQYFPPFFNPKNRINWFDFHLQSSTSTAVIAKADAMVSTAYTLLRMEFICSKKTSKVIRFFHVP